MLLSLVENAVKHGIEPRREGGEIVIRATMSDGKLRVSVTDTGRGLSAIPGDGVGLANLRERLHAIYGGAGRLSLESNLPSGVIAAIEIPHG